MKKLIYLVILIFITPALITSCGEQKKTYTKLNALVVSRSFVKEKLKSPASSEFGNSTDLVTQPNDTTFIIISYVDAQNSFGALIRSNYSCKIIYTPETDMANCYDLIIN
jgi:hypothetical protein